MLPALAIAIGLVGLAASTTPVAALGSGILVGVAVVLELAGWAGAARAHAPALGTAALIGAFACAVGLAGFALFDGSTQRDGVAALVRP
jgi:hypothetical protein